MRSRGEWHTRSELEPECFCRSEHQEPWPVQGRSRGSSPCAPTTVLKITTKSASCPWSEAGFESGTEGFREPARRHRSLVT
jgi:hypothetical protein